MRHRHPWRANRGAVRDEKSRRDELSDARRREQPRGVLPLGRDAEQEQPGKPRERIVRLEDASLEALRAGEGGGPAAKARFKPFLGVARGSTSRLQTGQRLGVCPREELV